MVKVANDVLGFSSAMESYINLILKRENYISHLGFKKQIERLAEDMVHRSLSSVIEIQKEVKDSPWESIRRVTEEIEFKVQPWLKTRMHIEETLKSDSIKEASKLQELIKSLSIPQIKIEETLKSDFIKEASKLQELIKSLSIPQIKIDREDIDVEGEDFDKNEVLTQLEALLTEDIDPENILKQCFDWIQSGNKLLRVLGLLLFLKVTFFDINININNVFNLNLTPNFYAEQYKDGVSQGLRNERKEVKKQAQALYTTKSLANHRFVKKNALDVRSSPSSRSNILDSVNFGKVVRVKSISKDRSWSEIEYSDDEDEVMSGWVFTRYLEKFK